ncbi:hypothetical protein GCM10010404_68500 [Nonomuraea africana]
MSACGNVVDGGWWGQPDRQADTQLYVGWHRYTLTGLHQPGWTWENRTEVLWSNRPLNATDVLFDARNETLPAMTDPCNEGPECGLPVRQAPTGAGRGSARPPATSPRSQEAHVKTLYRMSSPQSGSSGSRS